MHLHLNYSIGNYPFGSDERFRLEQPLDFRLLQIALLEVNCEGHILALDGNLILDNLLFNNFNGFLSTLQLQLRFGSDVFCDASVLADVLDGRVLDDDGLAGAILLEGVLG